MNNTLLEAILISRALCHSGLERTDVETALAAKGCRGGAVSADLISENMRERTNEKREPDAIAQAHRACGARQ